MAKQSLDTSRLVGMDREPNIGISEKDREGVIKLLTELLCDEYVLVTKTKKYHWNVISSDFGELHKFLEEQYEEIDEIVDKVAERIRTLGGQAVATLSEFMQFTRLKEDPGSYPNSSTMLTTLLQAHEATIRILRENADETDEKYHDMGTNDFLIGLMEQHEKMAWMLRSYLGEKSH